MISGASVGRLKFSALAAVLAAVSAGCEMGDDPLSKAPLAGESFYCTPIRLWGGAGPIGCSEGPVVRLAGVSVREIGGSCDAGQPCPRASAKESRDHLAGLLIGERRRNGIDFNTRSPIKLAGLPLSCVSTGPAEAGGTSAWCVSQFSGDLSCAMVAAGYAAEKAPSWREERCS